MAENSQPSSVPSNEGAAAAAPAPADASKPAAAVAETAYAVLTARRANLVAGQVVFAPAADIGALIAAGAARKPAAGEIDRARPFHFALPPLPAQEA